MNFLKHDAIGIGNPLSRMDELLSSGSDDTQCCLWATDWWDDGEKRSPKRDAVWAEFVTCYEKVVSILTAAWGPPQFDGDWQEPGYPDWFDVWTPHLAYWRRGSSFAFVFCDQQDTETPMELALGKRPIA